MESQPQNPEFRNFPGNFHPRTCAHAQHCPEHIGGGSQSYNFDVFSLVFSLVSLGDQEELFKPSSKIFY